MHVRCSLIYHDFRRLTQSFSDSLEQTHIAAFDYRLGYAEELVRHSGFAAAVQSYHGDTCNYAPAVDKERLVYNAEIVRYTVLIGLSVAAQNRGIRLSYKETAVGKIAELDDTEHCRSEDYCIDLQLDFDIEVALNMYGGGFAVEGVVFGQNSDRIELVPGVDYNPVRLG
jgi:hypothetical protein